MSSLNLSAGCGPFFGKFFRSTQEGLADTPEYKYRARQQKLENQANLFRTRKDNPDPAINLKIGEKIEKMNVFIFNNIHSPNERKWRTFFREYEADYISFERLSRLLKKIPKKEFTKTDLKKLLSASSPKFPKEYQDFLLRTFDSFEDSQSFTRALQYERSQTVPKLATHYQEYRMVRGNLEGLLEREDCDEICKKQVDLLLGRIGANSDKEKMINDVFFKGENRPDIEKMRKLLYEEQEFVITKLKRERNAEFFRFMKSFISQPAFVDTLFGYIYKNPKLKESPRVNFLFREIYNSHARNSHFPKISKVIRGPDNDAVSFDLLRRLNTSIDKDELLITFARRVDALADSKWEKLLAHAKENEPAFAQRMEKAAEVAVKRGDMSPTDRRSFVGRLAGLIVVGVPSFSYFYFDIKPSELMEIIYNEDGGEGSSTTTEIIDEQEVGEEGDLNPNGDGLGPMPEPDSGDPLLTGGEEEQILEDAAEIVSEMTGDLSRNPSSIFKKKKRKGRASFTRFWCSHFNCSKK